MFRMTAESRPWVRSEIVGGVGAIRAMGRFTRRRGAVAWQRGLQKHIGRFPLFAGTYLSKLSMPPFGAMGLVLTIPLLFGAAVAGFLSGAMVLNLRRALAFALMIAVLLSLQIVAVDQVSIGSLALLLTVHLPYIVQQRRLERNQDDVLQYFQRLALLIGILGIAQYGLQFVIGQKFAFPIENLVPAALKVEKFNSQGLLHYGSEVMRANGVFMIEPSIFSQLMAVGIVIEAVTRKRWFYFATMALAILVSYSGTGIMLLAVCLFFECIGQRRWDILFGAAGLGAAIMAIGVIAEIPMITNILDRAGEFGTKGSSASMRFVGGFQLFEQFLWPDPFRALFGFGAGSLAAFGMKSNMPLAEMMLFKPIFEYGIFGAIAYFGFLGFCVFSARVAMAIRIAVAMAIMLGGMYTPFGHCLACALLLWRNVAPGAVVKRHHAPSWRLRAN